MMSTGAESQPDEAAPQGKNPGTAWVMGEGLLPGDAYQEGPYVVFTTQYHLRLGYCCNSGCRHCPYK